MSSTLAVVPPIVYRFDRFELLPELEELRKNGTRIHLPPQPFRVLLLMVERAGEVVTREEIQAALWDSAVFVDYEQGINTAIRRIRFALNDHAETPRFLQTVPRRGYSFVAPVERIVPLPPRVVEPLRALDDWLPELPPEPVTAPVTKPERRRVPVRRLAAVAAAAAMLFAARAPHGTEAARRQVKPALRIAIAPVTLEGPLDPLFDPRRVHLELQTRLAVLQPQLIHVAERDGAADVRIETTVQNAGGAVRVNARMSEPSSGRQVWGETIHRELGKTDDLPLEIALRTAQAVSSHYIPPGREEPLVRSRVSAAALALYREARSMHARPIPQRDGDAALVRFQKAIELEPGFAEAWSGIGDIWSERTRAWMGESRAVALTQARIALQRAIALDPNCAEALNDYALLLMQHDRKYTEAEGFLRRAVAADPEYVHSHINLAVLLGAMGEHEQALASFRTAQLLDPHMMVPSTMLGTLYLMGHRPEEAMAEHQAALLIQRNPFAARWGMMWSAMATRRWDVAAVSLAAVLEEPVDLGDDADSGGAFRKQFRRLEPALIARERARRMDPYVLACFYSQLHDADKAFAALDRAIADHSMMAINAFVDPRLEFIRADPRFDARLERLGFRR